MLKRALLATAFVVAVLQPSSALGVAKVAAGPPGARFYTPPAQLIGGPAGTVIWARSLHTPSALPAAASATLVLYRSVLPNGKSTAVSGLIFTPRGKPPHGGWKLISWAHGTTGIADQCAPSRTPTSNYMYPQFNDWLKHGYVIAQTDYQGLGTPGVHLYLVGHAEGASVVNIALAARSIIPGIGHKFAIAGHSQGGQAALFAAAEAGRDAPGLKLVGVAAFAPASHIATQVKAAPALTSPGGGLSALGGLILTSAAADSPQVHLNALLTPPALALVPAVQRECLDRLSESDSWGGLAPSQIERPGADTSAVFKVLDAMNPAVKIAAPVLILQGDHDTTVFPVFTHQLHTELTGLGDSVDYRTVPGATHGTVVVAGDAAASSWLAQRFK